MPEQNQTRLSETLNEAMKEQGVSIRDLALATGVTYEHMRRLVRGLGSPAPQLLKLICSYLDLDELELTHYVEADIIERKYGDVPALMTGKNPELTPLERAWEHLTEAQKTDLTTMAQSMSRRNRGI